MRTKSVKTEGYSNATLHAKWERKRAEAIARNNAWARLSTGEQIMFLKDRRGNCERQLRRLGAI